MNLIEVVEITPTEKTFQKRVFVISDFVSKLEMHNDKNINLNFERNFRNILSIFLNKTRSKLIYVLYNVGVSSLWELTMHFNLGYMKDIRDLLFEFETQNIVEELYEESTENKAVRETWDELHPNGKRNYKKTKLFKLSDDVKPVVEQFLDEIYGKYLYKSDYANIERRKISFLKNYNSKIGKMDQEIDMEKNKIGNCSKCKKPIHKDSKDYTEVYDGVLLHNKCIKQTSPKEIIKWKPKSK